MGNPLYDAGHGRLQALPEADQMKLVGSPSRAAGNRILRDYLKANPHTAAVVGQVVRQIAEPIQAAMPGETRSETFSNQHWRSSGYEDIAEINELVGLHGR